MSANSQIKNIIMSSNKDQSKEGFDESQEQATSNVNYAQKSDSVDEIVNKVLSSSECEDLLLKKLAEKYGRFNIEEKLDSFNEVRRDEPILNPANRKFTAFPIKYNTIWEMYKKQFSCLWKPEEIDFANDYDDFLTLTKDEQYLIEMILAFFAASDGIVNFNLGDRFAREIQITEAQIAYRFQEMMEDVHSITYSLMLENIVRDPTRKEFLFNAIHTVPAVKNMADWAFKWIESPKEFAYRVVAFAIVEGVFFSGAFAAIFWIKRYKNESRDGAKGKPFMNGLISANKFIARDEGLHTLFACEIYKLLKHKLPTSEIVKIMREGVGVAKQFMVDSLPVRLIGMNAEMMEDYIEYIGDRLLIELGYKKIFNKTNPFKFMETIGFVDKTNFHETRPTEYQDSHVMQKSTKKGININDDF